MTDLTVNGSAVRYRLDPEMPLLWALREASNLTGTKFGCGTGDCGACIVVVDGRAVTSCTVTLGNVAGAEVTTIEGLAPGRSHPLQQAFIAEQVPQCGFCIPGVIMAASVLLRGNARPSSADIASALAQNICRCGIYPRITRAVQRAAAAMRGEAVQEAMA